jgi:hypothetical protein
MIGAGTLAESSLVWGATDWLAVAAIAGLVLFALLVFCYRRAPVAPGVRTAAAMLKFLGILILLLCLLDPLIASQRARPGANGFAILADNSQSMTLKDGTSSATRAEELKRSIPRDSPWLSQLAKDFDLRQFAFDGQLRPVDSVDALPFDGRSSDLTAALDRLTRRYAGAVTGGGQPLAGVLLLTDGSATDADALEAFLAKNAPDPANPARPLIPPIYPVLFGKASPPADISVERLDVTQTNFEDAPVTVAAQIAATGYKGRQLIAELLDEAGKPVEQQKVRIEADGEPVVARFRFRPENPGVSFYKVRVAAADGPGAGFEPFTRPELSSEATLANNTRMTVVDRGRGPYRILYVAGRPDWEFKFLQRALASEDQTQLVAFIRVAKREPKFNFLARNGEAINPLFSGFDNKEKDTAENYDQPVIIRLGTQDQEELKAGFPKTAEELFKYHAIILDRVESEFFTQDQMTLIKDFVRQRGGGFLMLGGQESFHNGKYDRTPIGDLLPVYTDVVPPPPVPPPASANMPEMQYKLALTREGWLEPWLRLRSEEDSERQRLAGMPGFEVVNQVRGIKPGATVLARVTTDATPNPIPALVEQRFGEGRAAALLIGDLWRWALQRPENTEPELEKAWRQTMRWLVGDVPQPVTATVDHRHEADDPDGAVRLVVQVRDPAYAPLDNANVMVKVTAPDKQTAEIRAEASPKHPGRYEALYVPRLPGPYRVDATVTSPDSAPVGTAAAGFTFDAAAEEFRSLQPNAALLERIARATGGEVVQAADLPRFAGTLPTRHAEIKEPVIQPLWHQSWVFLTAIACLAAEWGLRRWKGLP